MLNAINVIRPLPKTLNDLEDVDGQLTIRHSQAFFFGQHDVTHHVAKSMTDQDTRHVIVKQAETIVREMTIELTK
jgi:hypothetical protein